MTKIIYFLVALCIISQLAYPNKVYAAIETFHATGEYLIGEFDTIEIAELHALDDAKMSAVEQAGVYVENYTKTKDMKVVHDEVQVIASQRIRVINKKISKIVLDTGDVKIRADITAEVDTSDVEEYVAMKYEIRAEIKRQYTDIVRQKKSLDAKMIKLQSLIKNRRDYTNIELQAEKEKQKREYQAIMLCMEGIEKYGKQDYAAQIEALKKAIELDPKNCILYNNCAAGYEAVGDNAGAVKGYSIALIIDETYPHPYNNRGQIYLKNNKVDKAIRDFNMAIKYDALFDDAYNNLGAAYLVLGEYNKSIDCFDKAIDLNINHDQAYHNKAIAQSKKLGRNVVERIW